MTDAEAAALDPRGLTACHECDLLHRLVPLAPGERADCARCGALLYREPAGGVDRPLALTVTALMLLGASNLFPFIALNIEGRVEENLVVSGVVALWRAGMPDLAILVALTSIVFPLLVIASLLWLLAPLKVGMRAPGSATVLQLMRAIGPWALMGVFMLGALIAFVKLQDIATVIPGVSMFAFVGLIACATAATASFDVSLVWPRMGPTAVPAGGDTAHACGLEPCHVCGLLAPAGGPGNAGAHAHGALARGADAHGASARGADADGAFARGARYGASAHCARCGASAHCARCGATLHGPRKRHSLSRTWALVLSAMVLLVPANVYPVMTVVRFGQGDPSTILGGVTHLVAEGMWGLGLIVFVASVVVPGLKLGLLIYLLLSVQRRSPWRPRDRTRLYRVTEVVGAWSMVDIFLVGILTALVHLDQLATISPEIGASFFAAVVVLTMFAAHSFDPRLIWDHAVQRP